MDRSRGTVVMAWNVFRFCTRLRCLGSLMILLVLTLVAFTYYTIVLAIYGPALFLGGRRSLTALPVLLLFHALLVMLLWSYFSVVFTDPGRVPSNWMPKIDEERGDDEDPLVDSSASSPRDLNVVTGEPEHRRIRYCRKCNQFKPPRCHHCSVCGRCVLKMDHHCIWVVNCVGALNYKYFLLFLGFIFSISFLTLKNSVEIIFQQKVNKRSSMKDSVINDNEDELQTGNLVPSFNFYTFLETALVTISLLPYFMAFFTDEEISGPSTTLAASFIAFVLNLAFVLSILGFMIMHISFVAANTTTIEAYQIKMTPRWHYNLGWRKNYEQVFGTDKRYWFIPAYSEEDLRQMPALRGLEYPIEPDMEALQQL